MLNETEPSNGNKIIKDLIQIVKDKVLKNETIKQMKSELYSIAEAI